jgi:hypothetical protein
VRGGGIHKSITTVKTKDIPSACQFLMFLCHNLWFQPSDKHWLAFLYNRLVYICGITSYMHLLLFIKEFCF